MSINRSEAALQGSVDNTDCILVSPRELDGAGPASVTPHNPSAVWPCPGSPSEVQVFHPHPTASRPGMPHRQLTHVEGSTLPREGEPPPGDAQHQVCSTELVRPRGKEALKSEQSWGTHHFGV